MSRTSLRPPWVLIGTGITLFCLVQLARSLHGRLWCVGGPANGPVPAVVQHCWLLWLEWFAGLAGVLLFLAGLVLLVVRSRRRRRT